LNVLVQREAAAARQLEVDLLLEEHGIVVEDVGHRVGDARVADDGVEIGVGLDELLDAGEHARARLGEAVLEVHHLPSDFRRAARELVDPGAMPAGFVRHEKAAEDEETVLAEQRALTLGQDVLLHRHRSASYFARSTPRPPRIASATAPAAVLIPYEISRS